MDHLREWAGSETGPIEIADQIAATGQEIREAVSRGASPEEVVRIAKEGVKKAYEEAKAQFSPRRRPKFKVAGSVHDNMTSPYTKEGRVPTLFDELEPDKQRVLLPFAEKLRSEPFKKGLSGLSAVQQRIIMVLAQLLYETSPDPNRPSGSGLHDGWPTLYMSLYQLARECKGETGTKGGRDTEEIRKEVISLAQREFLLTWQEGSRGRRSGRPTTKTRTFVTYEKVIKVIGEIEVEQDDDTGEVLSETRDIHIGLNPLFAKGIAEYFYEYPGDLMARLEATKEGRRIPQAVDVLIRYLKTKQGYGKKKGGGTIPERIDKITLCEKLYPKWVAAKRVGQAVEYTQRALDHVVRAGLLSGYEETTGAQGQAQYILTIPATWDSL